jgi:hypothetical protein
MNLEKEIGFTLAATRRYFMWLLLALIIFTSKSSVAQTALMAYVMWMTGMALVTLPNWHKSVQARAKKTGRISMFTNVAAMTVTSASILLVWYGVEGIGGFVMAALMVVEPLMMIAHNLDTDKAAAQMEEAGTDYMLDREKLLIGFGYAWGRIMKTAPDGGKMFYAKLFNNNQGEMLEWIGGVADRFIEVWAKRNPREITQKMLAIYLHGESIELARKKEREEQHGKGAKENG